MGFQDHATAGPGGAEASGYRRTRGRGPPPAGCGNWLELCSRRELAGQAVVDVMALQLSFGVEVQSARLD